MTGELQSSHEASWIKLSALTNHIPCMAQSIQLALSGFRSSLGANVRTKSWEAHERDQRFGENGRIHIGKSQRIRKEGNARINKVLAMRPGVAEIIEKVRISWYFESRETDLYIAENICGIDYTDTWSSKQDHWVLKSHCPHCATSDYECEDTLELNTGVAQTHLQIMGIPTWVAPKSNIQWLPAPFHNSSWMDHCEVCHGSIKAILTLNPVDVKEAYSYIALWYCGVQCHVRPDGWHAENFG